MEHNCEKKNYRTLVIGLGEIGFHNCEYMTNMGLNVEGYDISEKAVKRAKDAGVIEKESKDFKNFDCYMICVSTHNPKQMEEPYLESLFEVVNRLGLEGKKNSLITIESTIKKGITKAVENILGHKFHVVHAPHRFYKNEKKVHGINQLRVLGACHVCCVEKALVFYEDFLEIPMHVVDDVEIAELAKIIENTYRMIEIAFAEELKMFCDSSNIDFEGLKAAINTKWNINILDALDGINGHCLPKDSQMYIDLIQDFVPVSIAASAKRIDETYKEKLKRSEKRPHVLSEAVFI